MRVFICILFCALTVSGCATQGVNSMKYTEPEMVKINNEITVDKPYSVVWDSLVKQISKSFYMINNIDKESRIVNVSFTVNNPENYVDCGKTSRTYTYNDKVENFLYDVAGSSRYKIAGNEQPHPSWISYAILNRSASLEGRANIYVAPKDIDHKKTIVSVNTRYIWSISVKGDTYIENFAGTVMPKGSLNLPQSQPIIFSTLSKGVDQSDGIKCVAKGTFEKEILELIK